MPSYWNDDLETFEQDWEPVILKKSNIPSSNINDNSDDKNKNKSIPLNRKIQLARSRNGYTLNEFAQKLHMKVKEYKKIEDGLIIPTQPLMAKLRKYLDSSLRL